MSSVSTLAIIKTCPAASAILGSWRKWISTVSCLRSGNIMIAPSSTYLSFQITSLTYFQSSAGSRCLQRNFVLIMLLTKHEFICLQNLVFNVYISKRTCRQEFLISLSSSWISKICSSSSKCWLRFFNICILLCCITFPLSQDSLLETSKTKTGKFSLSLS